MAKLVSELRCPGCQGKTAIAFRRPRFLEKVVVQARCQACESDWIVKISRSKKTKAKCEFEVRPLRESPLLQAMRAEEAAHNIALDQDEILGTTHHDPLGTPPAMPTP